MTSGRFQLFIVIYEILLFVNYNYLLFYLYGERSFAEGVKCFAPDLTACTKNFTLYKSLLYSSEMSQ
jgi:hypothetical protein